MSKLYKREIGDMIEIHFTHAGLIETAKIIGIDGWKYTCEIDIHGTLIETTVAIGNFAANNPRRFFSSATL